MLPNTARQKHVGHERLVVDFAWLKNMGLFNNRMSLHRARLDGFPAAIQLGPNRIAWESRRSPRMARFQAAPHAQNRRQQKGCLRVGGRPRMTLQREARPHARRSDADRAGCSLLGGENRPENSPAIQSPQAKRSAACPIILASHCRMTADLLAEAVEFTIHYGAAVLAAVREADDEGILESFRGFDVAARTARQCAEELRAYRGLLEAEGTQ